ARLFEVWRIVYERAPMTEAAASLLTLDPDRLRVHKGMKPEVREFSTVPAVLDAADRYARIGSSDAVDEHSARIQLTCDPAGQFNIPGPEIAAQPELACVRGFDGCVDVPYPGDCGNRPERLLIECGHALSHSAQDSRRVKGALAGHWLPPAQYARPLCDANFYLFMERVAKVGTSHRSHLHCGIERISETERLRRLNKQMLEFTGDLFQQDEAFGGQTHLARVMKAP